MTDSLTCLGCGKVVAEDVPPGTTLAISCGWCGAGSPILIQADGQYWLPASIAGSSGPLVSHLEYWLGYSDHESLAKTCMIQVLKERGSFSQKDCRDPDQHCAEAYKRGVAKWRERCARKNEIEAYQP